MRHILQRGLEVVRLLGNHGMSASMVVHLAKTFDGKVGGLNSILHICFFFFDCCYHQWQIKISDLYIFANKQKDYLCN